MHTKKYFPWLNLSIVIILVMSMVPNIVFSQGYPRELVSLKGYVTDNVYTHKTKNLEVVFFNKKPILYYFSNKKKVWQFIVADHTESMNGEKVTLPIWAATITAEGIRVRFHDPRKDISVIKFFPIPE